MFISINDYMHVHVSLDCTQHGEPLDHFCKSHYSPLCTKCKLIRHKACKDVISVINASKNVKTSIGLTDLEDEINDSLEDVKQLITCMDKK